MTTANLTSTIPAAVTATPRPASFRNTLAAEWSKIGSLRTTYLTLGLGVVLSIGTTAVASLAMGATDAEWPADFDPTLFSMVGNIFALIIYSVFGVLVVSREYSSGLVRVTLVATPQRGRLLFAKLALVNVTILILGLVTTVGMFIAGQAILGAYGLPTASLAECDVRWVVFGLGATMPFFPTLGLALGILLRSTAGAVTAVLGLLWLPQIFGEFMPMWWREHVISLLPGSALDSLTLGQLTGSPDYSDPALGAVITAVWLLATVGAAYVAFGRRDA